MARRVVGVKIKDEEFEFDLGDPDYPESVEIEKLARAPYDTWLRRTVKHQSRTDLGVLIVFLKRRTDPKFSFNSLKDFHFRLGKDFEWIWEGEPDPPDPDAPRCAECGQVLPDDEDDPDDEDREDDPDPL